MRAANDAHNVRVPDGHDSYIQFPVEVSDKKGNIDAKDALEAIMLRKIGPHFGELIWSKASIATHVLECDYVIEEAASSRSFIVYRQSSNLCCIRLLAEQNMNAKGRVTTAVCMPKFIKLGTQKPKKSVCNDNIPSGYVRHNEKIHNYIPHEQSTDSRKWP